MVEGNSRISSAPSEESAAMYIAPLLGEGRIGLVVPKQSTNLPFVEDIGKA